MIARKSKAELEILRQSNRIVAEILAEIKRSVVPGISTAELDRLAEKLILSRGAESAFKGYRGYPAVLCTSVNEEVIHGIPGRRRLAAGDIVSLDVGVKYHGFYGDAAVTVPVGEIDAEKKALLRVTEEALAEGIRQARSDNRVSDISHAVQSWVEKHGFSVVRDFVGHGIGRELHEDPPIPNYGAPHCGDLLRPGMVLAIEPMVNAGGCAVHVLPDNWTAVTRDGRPSAHFEHTVAVTADEPEILTQGR